MLNPAIPGIFECIRIQAQQGRGFRSNFLQQDVYRSGILFGLLEMEGLSHCTKAQISFRAVITTLLEISLALRIRGLLAARNFETSCRWDKERPATVDNLVLLTFDEAEAHETSDLENTQRNDSQFYERVMSVRRQIHFDLGIAKSNLQ